MWYRIELNKDGSVASCAEVEARAVEGRHVRYVEADSKAEAMKAMGAYRKRIAKVADRAKQRAEGFKAAGLCYRCGAQPDAGFASCADCRRRMNESDRRIAARARGESVPLLRSPRPKTQADEIAAQRRYEATRDTLKRARTSRALAVDPLLAERLVLEMALEKFDTLKGPAFREWLASAIIERSPRKSQFVRSVIHQHPADAE